MQGMELLIFAHHRQVIATEQDYIRENCAALLAAVPAISSVSNLITSVAEGSNPWANLTEFVTPRIGLGLLELGYEALQQCTNEERFTEITHFIGTTILPMAGCERQPAEAVAFDSRYSNEYCSFSEVSFHQILNQLSGLHDRPHQLVTVFHDATGQPLAIRKTKGLQTTLTLRSFQVVGRDGRVIGDIPLSDTGLVTIPAGTIAEVSVHRELGPIRKVEADDCTIYEACQLIDPISLHPLRMSAWAYRRQIDRALFATKFGSTVSTKGPTEIKSSRLELLSNVALEDYQTAAHLILKRCGVTARTSN